MEQTSNSTSVSADRMPSGSEQEEQREHNREEQSAEKESRISSWEEGSTAHRSDRPFSTLTGQRSLFGSLGKREIVRWASALGGGFLVFQGLRRSLGHLSLAGLGAGMLYWSMTGKSPLKRLQRRERITQQDAMVRIQDGKGPSLDFSPVRLTRSVIVKAELDEVFDVWANFENFPRFMDNIRSVRTVDEGVSHWVMDGPFGTELNWIAKTTRMEENQRVGWTTITGDITTSGQVTFTSLDDGETEISVTLQYVPPGGLVGFVLSELLDDPEEKLNRDLRNFKRYIEGRTVGEGTT